MSPFDWQGIREELFDGSPVEGDCDTSRKSVMALAVTCALLLVIYVCTVFCLCTSKKLSASAPDSKARSIDAITRNYMTSATYLR